MTGRLIHTECGKTITECQCPAIRIPDDLMTRVEAYRAYYVNDDSSDGPARTVAEYDAQTVKLALEMVEKKLEKPTTCEVILAAEVRRLEQELTRVCSRKTV